MKNMEIECVENGKLGVEKFLKSQIDYYDEIFMNIRMPVMDGIEAAKQIRELDIEDANSIPIIAMTANALSEDVEETKNVGINAHLSKPVEPKNLYETLAKCINGNNY